MDAVSMKCLCVGKSASGRGSVIALALAALLLPLSYARAQPVPTAESLTDCLQANRTLVAVYPKLGAVQSLAYSTRAVQICKEQNGAQHPDTLDSMNNLAITYRAAGRYAEALALNEESLALRRAIQGDEHPTTLISMNNLAVSYSDLGRYAEALTLHDETLMRRKLMLGIDHAETLNTMNNLAEIYSKLARYEEASALHDETLKRRKAKLGAAHPNTLISMSNLAASYAALGRYAQALLLRSENLALMRDTLGATHENTLVSMGNLATSYGMLGRYDEALALREEALKLLRNKVGAAHADTWVAMSNLALSYDNVGRHGEALALHEDVLNLRRTGFGADHADTLNSMNNLAESYGAVGRFGEALHLHEEGLKRSREKLGPAHSQTLTIMSNLAQLYGGVGRYGEALALNEEALNLRRTKLGATHPLTIGSMHNVAATHRELGAYEKALELHDETARLMRDTLGPEHPSTLTSQSNLAMSYRDVGRNEEAVKLNEQTLELKRQKLGAEHPGTLLTLHNLAQNYYSVGRLDEIPALGRAYMAGAEKQRGQKGLSVGEQQTLFADYANSYRQFARYFGRLAQDKPAGDAGAKPQQKSAEEGERKALLQEGFEIADRAKARTLIESISRQSAARAGGLSAGDQQALERLSGETAALEQALARQQDLARPDGEILHSLQSRKREVDALYLKLQDKLKAAYPKYAQLLDVKFARPADARTLLGTGQQVVSYVLENNGNISVWLLDQSGEPRFIDLGQHKTLTDTLTRLRQQISASDERPVSAELLQNLSAMLIHPLLAELASSARWIIIPDGDLALLPFDALLLPSGEPLINAYEISVVQSWSVYALLKQREAEYSKLTRAKNLLAVGNAVYEALSPDGAEKGATPNTAARSSYRTSVAFPLELAGGLREQAEHYALQNLSWSNLPGTAREMEAVSRIFGTGVDTLSGALASEAQMQALNRSGKLTGYRYLLFSAHGYLATNPMLTSLVLSQHQRTPEADGYITAAEWPGYDIRSDLTVFSACDTGVGRTLPGEGVMGLPYALFVAGNKNTLLTLWPVDDAATAEFMQRFFGRLAKGEAQISALIETKREFAVHPQWSAPLYWAGFVLYGV